MNIPKSVISAIAEREQAESKRRQQVWRVFVYGEVALINGKMVVKL